MAVRQHLSITFNAKNAFVEVQLPFERITEVLLLSPSVPFSIVQLVFNDAALALDAIIDKFCLLLGYNFVDGALKDLDQCVSNG